MVVPESPRSGPWPSVSRPSSRTWSRRICRTPPGGALLHLVEQHHGVGDGRRTTSVSWPAPPHSPHSQGRRGRTSRATECFSPYSLNVRCGPWARFVVEQGNSASALASSVLAHAGGPGGTGTTPSGGSGSGPRRPRDRAHRVGHGPGTARPWPMMRLASFLLPSAAKSLAGLTPRAGRPAGIPVQEAHPQFGHVVRADLLLLGPSVPRAAPVTGASFGWPRREGSRPPISGLQAWGCPPYLSREGGRPRSSASRSARSAWPSSSSSCCFELAHLVQAWTSPASQRATSAVSCSCRSARSAPEPLQPLLARRGRPPWPAPSPASSSGSTRPAAGSSISNGPASRSPIRSRDAALVESGRWPCPAGRNRAVIVAVGRAAAATRGRRRRSAPCGGPSVTALQAPRRIAMVVLHRRASPTNNLLEAGVSRAGSFSIRFAGNSSMVGRADHPPARRGPQHGLEHVWPAGPIAPSAAPAPTTVCSSSMKVMTSPVASALISFRDGLEPLLELAAVTWPRPPSRPGPSATKPPCRAVDSGTSPGPRSAGPGPLDDAGLAPRRASPISTGFVLGPAGDSTWITRRILGSPGR